MCDSVVATRAHSAAGSTLFAKNSDRPRGECQPLVQAPAALHERGSQVRCTHVTVPQVAETYRVMGHSPWWVWGFEQGVNEQGLAIGNQSVFSREPVEVEPGLIGMDLVRLGLERGRDAREALEVIAALLEKHGQGGSAFAPGAAGYHNSFTIADPGQAWLLETSGRRWAARRIEKGALSNQLSLADDWTIGSRDLESFARAEGWWRDPGRIDVGAAYRNPHVPARISEGRLRRSRELLDEGARLDAASMKRLLRDHGDGGAAPPTRATPDDERFYTLCMHSEPVGTTTASMVAALPLDLVAPWPVWVSFASPCTGLFLPVYLEASIPAELSRGGESAQRGSAWWAFHELAEAASQDFAHATPELRKAWAPLEERIEIERLEIETRARSAAVDGNRERAAALLSDFMQRCIDAALGRTTELVERAHEIAHG